MAKYQTHTRLATTPNQTNVTTTFKTMVEIKAATATLCRGQVYEVNVGADGAPNATDCQIIYDWSRCTVAGTGVASTPVALNPADVATRAACQINLTIEGTVTANSSVLELGLNQRASQRWIAAPGSELVWPATNANGIVARALSPVYPAPVMVSELYDDL